jgi:hypothetical protein
LVAACEGITNERVYREARTLSWREADRNSGD